ncbi:MAG: LytR family transcriptional regulator, partial [Clostridia bacterium]|nr:LytR family transcriptional regulator [Clostridia bacterium]
MTDSNKVTGNGKKKHSKLNIFLIILVILTVLAVMLTTVGVIYVKKNFNYKYNEITDNPEELGASDTVDEKIINIALFGVDTREENTFKGRSDSIMILSVSLNAKKIKLISVLRDSFV